MSSALLKYLFAIIFLIVLASVALMRSSVGVERVRSNEVAIVDVVPLEAFLKEHQERVRNSTPFDKKLYDEYLERYALSQEIRLAHFLIFRDKAVIEEFFPPQANIDYAFIYAKYVLSDKEKESVQARIKQGHVKLYEQLNQADENLKRALLEGKLTLINMELEIK